MQVNPIRWSEISARLDFEGPMALEDRREWAAIIRALDAEVMRWAEKKRGVG